jgi:hypothetical protein
MVSEITGAWKRRVLYSNILFVDTSSQAIQAKTIFSAPYMYEVLLVDPNKSFRVTLLNKESKYFQDTLNTFRLGLVSTSSYHYGNITSDSL